MLGKHRRRRNREKREEAVDVLRRAENELAVGLHHLRGLLERPERRPRVHRSHRMRAELERRDDAEVAAAAAQRPEQVGVLRLVCRDDAAVGQHDVGRQQVVDRQPVLAGEVADAAAERQAADAGRRDEPARHGQPEGMRGVIDVAPHAAAVDAHGAFGRIDADAFHRRQVDDQAIVAGTEPAAVVAAAANGGQQIVGARIVHGGDHVRHVDASHDERRPLVDHPVVDHASGLVRLVAGLDDGAAHAGT